MAHFGQIRLALVPTYGSIKSVRQGDATKRRDNDNPLGAIVMDDRTFTVVNPEGKTVYRYFDKNVYQLLKSFTQGDLAVVTFEGECELFAVDFDKRHKAAKEIDRYYADQGFIGCHIKFFTCDGFWSNPSIHDSLVSPVFK